MSVLVVTAGGLRHQWKPRWAVYCAAQCRLLLYRSSEEAELLGELSILTATFTYDLENDSSGVFKLWSVHK